MKELFLGGCIFYDKNHRKSQMMFYLKESGDIQTVVKVVGGKS